MSSYLRPADLADALTLRAAHPTHTLLAGGTDLMVAWRQGEGPDGVIDLFSLPELKGITVDATGVTIGAATPYAEILAHEPLVRTLPLLAAVAREIGAVQLRERATIGGNLATCSPVGDGLIALLALGAEIETASTRGRRRTPAAEFVTGYRRTALRADEIVTAIHVPAPPPDLGWYWRKIGSRRAQGIAKVSLAATASLDEHGTIVALLLALGAVADRPVRLAGTEALLTGARPDAAASRAAAALARTEISPIDDLRSRAHYRSTVAGNLVAAFVTSLRRRNAPGA